MELEGLGSVMVVKTVSYQMCVDFLVSQAPGEFTTE